MSGTAKQHVAFDYARRLARGIAAADEVMVRGMAALRGGRSWVVCHRLNETVCNATQLAGDGATISVALWNQLAVDRMELVRVPVGSEAVQVVDAVTGAAVAVQLLPAGETVTNYRRRTGEATFVAVFEASLPPVGYRVYLITQGGTQRRITSDLRAKAKRRDLADPSDTTRLHCKMRTRSRGSPIHRQNSK